MFGKIMSNNAYQQLWDDKNNAEKKVEELTEQLQNAIYARNTYSKEVDELTAKLRSLEENHQYDLKMNQQQTQKMRAELNEAQVIVASAEERIKTEVAAAIKQTAERHAIAELDRKGLELICAQAYPMICGVEAEDDCHRLEYRHSNDYGDRLYMKLPQGICVQRLSQLAELMVPQEFPELTEYLRLDRELNNLELRYLPLSNIYWEANNRTASESSASVTVTLNIGDGDLGGFMLVVPHVKESFDEDRYNLLMRNLADKVIEREDEGQDHNPFLCFEHDDEEIYLIRGRYECVTHGHDSKTGWNSSVQPFWKKQDNGISRACQARWGAYLPGVVVPRLVLNEI